MRLDYIIIFTLSFVIGCLYAAPFLLSLGGASLMTYCYANKVI